MADAYCRAVVLGSFPGVASLDAQCYYAHPRNALWRILGELWGQDLLHANTAGRIAACLAHGMGLWDVYAACEREGSADVAIRMPVLNDFGWLRRHCPQLGAVLHNGAESWRHHLAVSAALCAEDSSGNLVASEGATAIQPAAAHKANRQAPLPAPNSFALPSTSPAHASWSYERKRDAWFAVLRQCGVDQPLAGGV